MLRRRSVDPVSVDALSVDAIAEIIQAGANVRISSKSAVPAEALVKLAAKARECNTILEIQGNLPVDSLVDIARAGGIHVSIDLRQRSIA
jgi:hypothetical protein